MKRSFLIYALFFICSVVQAQWECAYDGTTGNLTSRQGVNGTEQENLSTILQKPIIIINMQIITAEE
ncbi:MAG: hypothetical protein J6I60_04240 [Bacteroidaceae bacterium]|nr:hypothetical protein [Bacteroidaceae bacterium]